MHSSRLSVLTAQCSGTTAGHYPVQHQSIPATATVEPFNPLCSPLPPTGHHGSEVCKQFHANKRRLSKPERLKRGKQRDKARLQALRDQLAAYTSSSDSAAEERSMPTDLQQQLDAALIHVSHLEERIRHLLAIIAQLSPPETVEKDSIARAKQGATAVIFDLFDYESNFSEVAVQTSISVDWSKPDIFVTLSTAADGADAAAGSDATSGQQPTPVLFDAIAPTCSANKEDIHSRDLAEQCGPLPNSTSPECFDAIAPTSKAYKEDFSSHDLAEQSGSLPICASPVHFDAIAPTCNANKEDFNSHDLAGQCGPLLNGASSELFVARAPTSPDLAAQCRPLPHGASPGLPDANAPSNQEDFNSQDLAEQRGPLPNSPPHVLFNASTHDDFNSRDLAEQCGPLPNEPSVSSDVGGALGTSQVREADDVIPASGNLGGRCVDDADKFAHYEVLKEQIMKLPIHSRLEHLESLHKWLNQS